MVLWFYGSVVRPPARLRPNQTNRPSPSLTHPSLLAQFSSRRWKSMTDVRSVPVYCDASLAAVELQVLN